MFADLRTHPQVTSLIYYNLRKGADWPVTGDRAAARAYAAGTRSLRGPIG
jgi:hypothetical protein